MLKSTFSPSGRGQLGAASSLAVGTSGDDCDICAAAKDANSMNAAAIRHVRVIVIVRAVLLLV